MKRIFIDRFTDKEVPLTEKYWVCLARSEEDAIAKFGIKHPESSPITIYTKKDRIPGALAIYYIVYEKSAAMVGAGNQFDI